MMLLPPSSYADDLIRLPSADHGRRYNNILHVNYVCRGLDYVRRGRGCTKNLRVRVIRLIYSSEGEQRQQINRRWTPLFIDELRCHGMGKGGSEAEANVEVETILQLQLIANN